MLNVLIQSLKFKITHKKCLLFVIVFSSFGLHASEKSKDILTSEDVVHVSWNDKRYKDPEENDDYYGGLLEAWVTKHGQKYAIARRYEVDGRESWAQICCNFCCPIPSNKEADLPIDCGANARHMALTNNDVNLLYMAAFKLLRNPKNLFTPEGLKELTKVSLQGTFVIRDLKKMQ